MVMLESWTLRKKLLDWIKMELYKYCDFKSYKFQSPATFWLPVLRKFIMLLYKQSTGTTKFGNHISVDLSFLGVHRSFFSMYFHFL